MFNALHSKECSCGGSYKPVKGRKQYQCSKCRFQIAPTSGTIFHKSDTPLSVWFYAVMLFSNAKSGLSAKQLERDLNVTYKTAWRILKLVRESLGQDGDKLSGDVEMDEMAFGGKGKAGRNNENLSKVMEEKSTIVGATERKGKTVAKVTVSRGARVLGQFLEDNVAVDGTRLMTDEYVGYKTVAKAYNRHTVKHKIKEYARGDVHTNTIEGFWGHVKSSVRGTHKVVSKKYLQSYLDGFVFHANNRGNDKLRFEVLLGKLLSA